MIYMFKKRMFENEHYTIISKKCEIGNFCLQIGLSGISEVFLQKIQVRWRQIGEVVFFNWAKVAFYRDVFLNFGVSQLCHKPGNLDLH